MVRRPSSSLTALSALCALAALISCTREKGAQTPPQTLATDDAAPEPALAAPGPPRPGQPAPEVCALHVSSRVSAANATPFRRAAGEVAETFSTFVSKPPAPRDQCFVAQETLASLGAQARGAGAGPAYAHVMATSSEPRYLDRIDAHFHLTPAERARLQANRFVVLDRLPYVSYAAAFHDIFQEQLPLYVGIDPILHAAAHETEGSLIAVERNTLAPALTRMLKKMRATLRASAQLDHTTKADLDVYLGFAWHYAKGADPRNARSARHALRSRRRAGAPPHEHGHRSRRAVRTHAHDRLFAAHAARALRANIERRAASSTRQLLPRHDVADAPGVEPGVARLHQLGAAPRQIGDSARSTRRHGARRAGAEQRRASRARDLRENVRRLCGSARRREHARAADAHATRRHQRHRARCAGQAGR